ncbi:cobyric acid synthase CobQ [Altericista sp. CCNU0014]|uniref:cobyric acid synthase CobQ n=1 Tax=Altericista sp. CCNU0014 TaxID=3082949 RepID=UPI00384D7B81
MVVGTTSHAGKSMLTAAICRMLKRRGYRVSPFKGQNMALNAYVTDEGLEMGHAQAVQAWAAGVKPQIAMNPILLKPQGNMTSQIIMKGQVVGQVQAADYYRLYFERGWQAIVESLETLQQSFDWIVCEGAGSPAEINLKHRDLTNMRVAKHLNAPTLLVADIDRGGVFAHIVGTLELLDPDERALIQGFVINKFRGQRSLLESGLTWLEERTGIPVVGVIPWVDEVFPSEDSLSLLERPVRGEVRDISIAVVRLPRVANFTDFDPLEAEPTVQVRYILPGQALGSPDAVILPGSKTTIADMQVLHESGLAAQIQSFAKAGGMVLGICGGFQMLGEAIADPHGLEGEAIAVSGLGLLPMKTEMALEKTTRQRTTQSRILSEHFSQFSRVCKICGYEIHQGQTQILDPSTLLSLFDDPSLGVVSLENGVMGTYLHDLFGNGPWRRMWLNQLRDRKGLPLLETQIPPYEIQRDQLLDRITDAVSPHLDLSTLMADPLEP